MIWLSLIRFGNASCPLCVLLVVNAKLGQKVGVSNLMVGGRARICVSPAAARDPFQQTTSAAGGWRRAGIYSIQSLLRKP